MNNRRYDTQRDNDYNQQAGARLYNNQRSNSGQRSNNKSGIQQKMRNQKFTQVVDNQQRKKQNNYNLNVRSDSFHGDNMQNSQRSNGSQGKNRSQSQLSQNQQVNQFYYPQKKKNFGNYDQNQILYQEPMIQNYDKNQNTQLRNKMSNNQVNNLRNQFQAQPQQYQIVQQVPVNVQSKRIAKQNRLAQQQQQQMMFNQQQQQMYIQQTQHQEQQARMESRITYNTQKEQIRAKGGRITRNNQGKTLRLNPQVLNQKGSARQQKIQQQQQPQKQQQQQQQQQKVQNNPNQQQRTRSQPKNQTSKNVPQNQKQNDVQDKRQAVSAQDEARKSGVLPVSDPTADPFKKEKNLTIPKNKGDLKKLQVKVDLTKIGDAPRAYQQILKDAEDSEIMKIDSTVDGHDSLSERFSNIQNAIPALHQMTIRLMNAERGIFGPQSGQLPLSIPVSNSSQEHNPENTKMTNAQKNVVKEKLAKRREQGGAATLKINRLNNKAKQQYRYARKQN